MWQVIIGPVIGALTALAGVWLNSRNQRLLVESGHTAQRNVILRERYEELTQHIMEAAKQIRGVAENYCSTGIVGPCPTAPRRAYILTLLYFPELRELAREYCDATSDHRVCLSELPRESISTSAGSLPKAGRDSRPDVQALRKIAAAEEDLEAAICEYAPKYTRA